MEAAVNQLIPHVCGQGLQAELVEPTQALCGCFFSFPPYFLFFVFFLNMFKYFSKFCFLIIQFLPFNTTISSLFGSFSFRVGLLFIILLPVFCIHFLP